MVPFFRNPTWSDGFSHSLRHCGRSHGQPASICVHVAGFVKVGGHLCPSELESARLLSPSFFLMIHTAYHVLSAGAALWRSIQVSSATSIVFGAETREGIDGIIEKVRKNSIALYCEGGPSPHAHDITSELLNYPITAPDRSVRSGLTANDIWGFIFTR